MSNSEIYGEWGNFVFKKVLPEDYPKILKHLRECLYYPAFYRLNYEKHMDDQCDQIFVKTLEQGQDLCLYAEEKKSGKVACTRIVGLEFKNPPPANCDFLTDPILKSIVKFYNDILGDGKIFDKYDYEVLPHMFGLSTDPEFQRQGLAIEMYKRSKMMLKEAGHQVSIVGFISPYSRAAGVKNGFKETSRRYLHTAMNMETGGAINPCANTTDFLNIGVFEL